jgi:Ca-activated chloride channel homolog
MSKLLRTAALFIPVLWFASTGRAFQSESEATRVAIAPRVRITVNSNTEESPNSHLRVDASLVLVPAHVTTPYGTPVTNLNRENFRVFEDSIEQTITYFAKEDAPLSVGLLFDSSRSMLDKRPRALQAAAAFFKTANANDEFFLIEFDERPRLSVPFAEDSEQLYRHLVHSKPYGRTSLFDAVHLALAQMKKARNQRKVIVILSDGGDNRSHTTFGQIKSELVESDVQLYAMGIFDPMDSKDSKTRAAEELRGPQVLDDLAWESGGKHFRIDNIDDLPAISERIGNELRNEYMLGYSPSNESRDGRYRRIKLNLATEEVQPLPLRTYYRQGYYAPAQ